MGIYTVIRQKVVAVPVSRVWDCLTKPELISKWFANTERLAPGEEFKFDFGDGDYFAGRVLELEEPTFLRLKWRFWEVGPEFEIRFSLFPLEAGIEVSVQDRGALTVGEAYGLREGWDDFLSRLDQFAVTGRCARYQWSQTIGATALLSGRAQAQLAELRDEAWWRSRFPTSAMTMSCDEGSSISLRFRDVAWGPVETEAIVTVDSLADAKTVEVSHQGWTGLAPERQIAERRRFAARWREVLRSLECQGCAV
jgi:uncharacterized protein YndB with AHSA1/START domain